MDKILSDKVDIALLIFPMWKSQPWFPLVLSNIVSFPVRLPRHRDLLSLGHNHQPHPLCKSLRLTAVCGSLSRIHQFHLKLQNLSSSHGIMEQENNTMLHGNSGTFGVLNKIVVPFFPLKKR